MLAITDCTRDGVCFVPRDRDHVITHSFVRPCCSNSHSFVRPCCSNSHSFVRPCCSNSHLRSVRADRSSYVSRQEGHWWLSASFYFPFILNISVIVIIFFVIIFFLVIIRFVVVVILIIYRLAGLVVKSSAPGVEDPGFKSRLRRDFSGSSHTSDFKIGISVATLPGSWH